MGCQSAVQAVRAISSTTEAADLPEVSALLGFGDAAEDERGLLVDIAVRRAVEAGLLRLRTGILRPAKRHLPLLDDPAALWFRLLSALATPDMAFTDLLGEHSGYRYAGFSPGHDVAELTWLPGTGGTGARAAQMQKARGVRCACSCCWRAPWAYSPGTRTAGGLLPAWAGSARR
jgi:hypothetical protein